MTDGPDRNTWVRGVSGTIQRVTYFGDVTSFPGPKETTLVYTGDWPNCITAGPDGAIYYLSQTTPVTIVRMALDGTYTQISIGEEFIEPGSIVVGPDGALWFTVHSNVTDRWEVGWYTVGGSVTPPTTAVPGTHLFPTAGRVWIGDATSSQLGYAGSDRVYHQVFSAPNYADADVGPGDTFWASFNYDTIGVISVPPDIRYIELQTADYQSFFDPTSMHLGPDGVEWMLVTRKSDQRRALLRVLPDGEYFGYFLDASIIPSSLSNGADEDLTFVDQVRSRVLQVGIGPWVHFLKAVYLDSLGRPLDDGANTYFSGLWWDNTVSDSTAMSAILVNSDEYLLARVNRLYEQLLRRDAEDSGKQYWANLLRSGWRAETLEVALVGSDEYWTTQGHSDIDTYITAVYHDLLGRAPEPGGLAYWHNLLASGANRMVVANGIVFSREALQKVVADLYAHYLHRGTDPGGLSYWTDQLQNGMTDETLVVLLAGSDEYYNNAQQ